MEKRCYTQEDVRREFDKWMEKMSQSALARSANVPPQTISITTKGVPIGGKLLRWLGFERVEQHYRKVK
jgi:hypothetical protein